MKQNSYKKKDHFSLKAQKEGFPARSVYKLQEIQRKYKLIKKGDTVLDLGCAPGSWLAFASKIAGSAGLVIGIDIKPLTVKESDCLKVYGENAANDGIFEDIGKKFDVILSDMAPSTTGIKHVDCARSFDLCVLALDVAEKWLKPGGNFVCKIFQGSDFMQFYEDVKKRFEIKNIFKPKSSRKTSKEIYIIGINKAI